jgi:hypothetical protein
MDIKHLKLEIDIGKMENLVHSTQKLVPLYNQENPTVFFREIIA